MLESGAVLLLIALAALLALFAGHARGKSLDMLIEDNEDLHHQVHRVLAKHPKGGTWAEFTAWMKEADTKP